MASCRLAPVLDSLKVSRIFLRSTPGTGIARFRLLKTLQSGEEACAVALSGVCEAVPRIGRGSAQTLPANKAIVTARIVISPRMMCLLPGQRASRDAPCLLALMHPNL